MPQLANRSLSGGDPEAKRRKIRKGTHSCWECRRRKTRCQYASAAAAVCVGCEARGSVCVSQEFPDEQPSTSERGLSQRLNKVEGLLEKLVDRLAPGFYTPDQPGEPALTSSASAEDDPDSSSDVLRPSATDVQHIRGIFDALREETSTYASSHTSYVPTPASTEGEVVPILPAKYAQVSKALHAVFPCQHDIEAIMAVGSSAYFIASFYNGIDGPCEPLSSISKIPPVTSHPAFLAKRLMQVINCYQKMTPAAIPQDLVCKEPFRPQISRMVNAVSDLVISNDDLVGSAEGLETIGLVSLYHANAGNLRKSWLSLRRAFSVALLMGVDKWPDSKPLRSVDPLSDPSTRSRASWVWFRLNFSDRYLSLLLGLSAASESDSFAEADVLAQIAPEERLSRLHAVITAKIIKRNQSSHKVGGDTAFGTTQAIDCDLELAAKSMGAEWWQSPVRHADPSTATPYELVRAHAHTLLQMNHQHLLILLHLPYMMRDPKERRWDYSKMTCLHASRELLRTYLFFRQLNQAASACRHTDYGALTAGMTLLLGYLDPNLRSRDAATACQRNADRELVCTVRDVMKGIADNEEDKLSRETSDIITRLLPLTDVDLMSESRGGLESAVRLEIPYLGTININPVNRRMPPQRLHQRQQNSGSSITPASTIYGDVRGYAEDNSLQSIAATNSASIDPSLQQSPQPPQPPQVTSSFVTLLGEDPNFSFQQFEPDLCSPCQFPELAADVDKWTFQGYDATFFESLFS
ncbi:hypothetical protein GGR54DRAFT_517206 [Hypoxylon sp. NC1633]|nr:hypothetical protein GGR54DRAFT_517206 [Hypoxylon sp. NC1633]